MNNCPCGSSHAFSDCCELYLSGKQAAPTPETLMRSRYTAYTLKNISYIARTMKGPALMDFSEDNMMKWMNKVTWTGLEVIHSMSEKLEGTVEFKANYLMDNRKYVLYEFSQFVKENNEWFYVDGNALNSQNQKIGFNDPCPCASGKKFKKCCARRTN